MRKDKIIYWITTSVVGIVILTSALFFCFSSEAIAAFKHLGFPAYFRIELTVAKLLGFVGLMFPGLPHRIKEFSYFGLSIVISSAVIAHFSSGDGLAALDPLFFLGMLIISYIYYHKLINVVPARKQFIDTTL